MEYPYPKVLILTSGSRNNGTADDGVVVSGNGLKDENDFKEF